MEYEKRHRKCLGIFRKCFERFQDGPSNAENVSKLLREAFEGRGRFQVVQLGCHLGCRNHMGPNGAPPLAYWVRKWSCGRKERISRGSSSLSHMEGTDPLGILPLGATNPWGCSLPKPHPICHLLPPSHNVVHMDFLKNQTPSTLSKFVEKIFTYRMLNIFH